MVEAKIAERTERNPILQKLKSGNTISEEEAQQLAEELHEEDPTYYRITFTKSL